MIGMAGGLEFASMLTPGQFSKYSKAPLNSKSFTRDFVIRALVGSIHLTHKTKKNSRRMTTLIAPGTSSIPPSCTIYVRGLNEKIPKKQLKHILYCLFSCFGQVFDIVALKTLKMRGQAFIVYGSIEEATKALRNCQGMQFLGKPMTIQYAMGRSNILNVIQGTYRPSVKSTLKRAGEELNGTDKKSKEQGKF